MDQIARPADQPRRRALKRSGCTRKETVPKIRASPARPSCPSAERVDVTIVNLSILKTNKAKAIRFSTFDASAGP